jgi:hypothetical protein
VIGYIVGSNITRSVLHNYTKSLNQETKSKILEWQQDDEVRKKESNLIQI